MTHPFGTDYVDHDETAIGVPQVVRDVAWRILDGLIAVTMIALGISLATS